MRKHEKKKNILLNNLGEKHSLLMKFGQFIKFYQTTQQKLPPEIYFHTLCIFKELSTTSNEKLTFWSKLPI